jgi:UDPglucose--hexose-1-phosphate uridylyltransferase
MSPHRRYNPLRREWVLVSPHRTQRPWQGEVSQSSGFSDVIYDPACYLCPGNERAGGHQNPDYRGVFLFDNDYAALLPKGDETGNWPQQSPLLRAEPETGLCRVVCFHPHHNLTLALMQNKQIVPVVDAWQQQYRDLGADPAISYVQIFENRGAMMGASNPHPHCQIWATEHIPDEPQAEGESLRAYRDELGGCLLCDYLAEETSLQTRIVCENQEFTALVPWWAVWPFETMVLPKRHLGSLNSFDEKTRLALADILRQITTRYDNLFESSFPYTMGFHQSPVTPGEHTEWHFHAHFYPPLLRSATVRKFMVGFEMLGMPQRDITAESAAERLRGTPDIHFTRRQ